MRSEGSMRDVRRCPARELRSWTGAVLSAGAKCEGSKRRFPRSEVNLWWSPHWSAAHASRYTKSYSSCTAQFNSLSPHVHQPVRYQQLGQCLGCWLLLTVSTGVWRCNILICRSLLVWQQCQIYRVTHIGSNLCEATKIWGFGRKLFPRLNWKKKSNQIPEDVLRTMAS